MLYIEYILFKNHPFITGENIDQRGISIWASNNHKKIKSDHKENIHEHLNKSHYYYYYGP